MQSKIKNQIITSIMISGISQDDAQFLKEYVETLPEHVLPQLLVAFQKYQGAQQAYVDFIRLLKKAGTDASPEHVESALRTVLARG